MAEGAAELMSRARPRCAKCQGKLTDTQVEAVGLLYRGGVQGTKVYCEKCWPEVKDSNRKPMFKKYTHAGYRERAMHEAGE